MNIKVQCDCGAKFAFDVEPVNGQMPCAIACPQCGSDATAKANEVIASTVSASAPPAPSGLRVAAIAAPPKAAAPAPAPAVPGVAFCSRHPRQQVQSHCYVCGKPICMECMQVFGYLCSATCRYQAEQKGIRIPECEFKVTVAETRDWRKVGAAVVCILILFAALAAGWFWFTMFGSHPKLYYSVRAGGQEWFTHAQFVDQSRILVSNDKEIALHDVDKKQLVWKRPFDQKNGFGFGEHPQMFVTNNNAWVCLPEFILRLDLSNGNLLTGVPLKGLLKRAALEKGELRVETSNGVEDSISHIDLATGNAQTESFKITNIAKTVKDRDISQLIPTAGALLNQELNQPKLVGQERSEFIPAGENVAEMQVRMVEEHFVEVEAIKPNKGPSKLNENVSAGTPVAPIAEEIANDIARSRGEAYKTVDQSKYSVLLRRNGKDTPEWHGDVIGRPFFFALKTVDVLTAGQGIWIFDKQNKLLKQDKLGYTIPEEFGMLSGLGDAPPCREENGTLYFYDAGVLTAFALPNGEVRWRLPSVGISSVQLDGKGALYVCSTTASPEDIQYTKQVKMQDRISPVLMKVEAKSGKVLWKVTNVGVKCYLAGKYVYGSDVHTRTGPPLVTGLAQAFGTPGGGSSNFKLIRLDPDNGKPLWDYFHEGIPDQLDFKNNRILIQYNDRVLVLKFLTLF